jgi:radical SAM protein with 4Fe4S-binding SPASM domain
MDSCNVPGAINFCKSILPESLDTCEGGRYSCYIGADMTMVPCSFDQKRQFAVQLKPLSIADGWNSDAFERFRHPLKHACPGCPHQELCMGGCPLMPEIVFCSRKERQ